MKKLKEVIRAEKEIEDIICNRCAKSCKDGGSGGVSEYGFETTTVFYNSGYSSKFFGDGTNVEFDLCEECVYWLTKQLIIPAEFDTPYWSV